MCLLFLNFNTRYVFYIKEKCGYLLENTAIWFILWISKHLSYFTFLSL